MMSMPDDYDPRFGSPIIPVPKDNMMEIIESKYDPVFNLAVQNIAPMNMSIDFHRCTECNRIGRGISNVQDMTFTCRDCLLKKEITRLHSDPEIERGYRVWKLKRARANRELQKNLVCKTFKYVPDLDEISTIKDLYKGE